MNAAGQYRRQIVIYCGLLLAFLWLAGRLYGIQVLRHEMLTKKARAYSDTTRVIAAVRGEIQDRNHVSLAMSAPVENIFINLPVCSNRVDQVTLTCSRLLNVPADELRNRLVPAWQPRANGKAPPKELLLLREVEPAQWEQIKSALLVETFGFDKTRLNAKEKAELKRLRNTLLYAEDEQVRRHPYGSYLSRLFGIRRLCGLEHTCDAMLAGHDGQCISEQDAAGNELRWRRTGYTPATNGNNVILTIDAPFQQQVEQILELARENCQAHGASALVMDPHTFEILAVAGSPNFNQENPPPSSTNLWGNPAFGAAEEPGSIFKIVVLAAALEKGRLTLDSSIYCEEGSWTQNRMTVHDHGRYGLLTLLMGFAKSSNILFAKLANYLGPETLYQQMTNFGFGNCTHALFIEEAPGRIDRPSAWADLKLTTRAGFGQGFTVTQLQMAVAVSVIANGGWLLRPTIVKQVESPGGKILAQWPPQVIRRIISPQTAAQVTEGMKTVASAGTGIKAAMKSNAVAVKTGTAQKSNAQGYKKGAYYASMVGFFPADAPQVVIVVAMDEPQKGYYGGDVAAPAFRAIAEAAAKRFNIKPDKLSQPPATGPARRPGNNASRPTTARQEIKPENNQLAWEDAFLP